MCICIPLTGHSHKYVAPLLLLRCNLILFSFVFVFSCPHLSRNRDQLTVLLVIIHHMAEGNFEITSQPLVQVQTSTPSLPTLFGRACILQVESPCNPNIIRSKPWDRRGLEVILSLCFTDEETEVHLKRPPSRSPLIKWQGRSENPGGSLQLCSHGFFSVPNLSLKPAALPCRSLSTCSSVGLLSAFQTFAAILPFVLMSTFFLHKKRE